jgi:hypothetical protein
MVNRGYVSVDIVAGATDQPLDLFKIRIVFPYSSLSLKDLVEHLSIISDDNLTLEASLFGFRKFLMLRQRLRCRSYNISMCKECFMRLHSCPKLSDLQSQQFSLIFKGILRQAFFSLSANNLGIGYNF